MRRFWMPLFWVLTAFLVLLSTFLFVVLALVLWQVREMAQWAM